MRIGIICEYNPFHNGHIYHIEKIKERYPDSTIILVVDSFFTERGDISVLDKKAKTEIALENNIDLVVELPFCFATQSADQFAYGAISILNKLDIDLLIFGSESDNVDSLKETALTELEEEKYDNVVKDFLDEGVNYPTALSKALNVFTGYNINKPNDLLGISYIKAIILTNSKIKPETIKRTNDYNDLSISNISSATAIRKALSSKCDISSAVPETTKKHVRFIDEEMYFKLLKLKIIADIDDLEIYQTVDEGIENRIRKFIYNSKSLDELILNIKTKRYTYNKIRRMLVHILCSFKKSESKNLEIEYLRVLGFNKKGQKVLNSVKKDLDVPIYFNYKEKMNRYLDLDFKAATIYSLIVNDSAIIEDEFKIFPIKK